MMCVLQDHDIWTCYEMVMQCDVKWYNRWINELVECLRLSCESYLWCGFMQEIEEKILDRLSIENENEWFIIR